MGELRPPVVFTWRARPRPSQVYHVLKTRVDFGKGQIVLDARTICGVFAQGPEFNGRQNFGYDVTEDEENPKGRGLRLCSTCAKLRA